MSEEDTYDQIFNRNVKRLQTSKQKQEIINDIAKEFEDNGMPLPKISSEIKRRMRERSEELEMSDAWIEKTLDDKYKRPKKEDSSRTNNRSATELESSINKENNPPVIDTSGNVVNEEGSTQQPQPKQEDVNMLKNQLRQKDESLELYKEKLAEASETIRQQSKPTPADQFNKLEVVITRQNVMDMLRKYDLKLRELNADGKPEEATNLKNIMIFILTYNVDSKTVEKIDTDTD